MAVVPRLSPETWVGARANLPLAIAIVPFALVYGVAVTESGIVDWVGGLASIVVVAGAAQLALVDLIDQGAPWVVAVATALVVNARFVMYSGALSAAFGEFPRRSRYSLPFLMTDQAAAAAILHFQKELDPTKRRRFYFGAASIMVIPWITGTWVGIIFGGGIPDGLQLGFAIPLMFLALLVPTIRERSALVAAVVGGLITVLAQPLPFSLSIVVGAIAGIIAGLMVKR